MVRLSKIPEISLHQDNKRLQRINIRLAANGTIRIYPTAIGGIFQVSTFQNALESTDYINYNKVDKILTIGGDAVDSSGATLESIVFDAKNVIKIGSAGNNNPDIILDTTTTLIEADETFELIAQNMIMKSNTYLEMNALDDIYIGRDASGTLMANSLTFSASTIDMSGAMVNIHADLNVDGDLFFEGNVQFMADITFNQRLVANDGAYLNIMNNSNNARTHGIYMIDTDDPNFVIYACDNSGNGPDNLPVHQSEIDGKSIRIRIGNKVGEGFIIETSTDEIFSINSSGTTTIPGDVIINKNANISGDAIINGNIEFNEGFLDTSGNLEISGKLVASSLETTGCTIDVSGNMELNGTGTFLNITSSIFTGDTCNFNTLSSDGVYIDGITGNLTCSGDIIIGQDLFINGTLTIGISTIDSSGNANFNGSAQFTNIIGDSITLDGITIGNDRIDCSGDMYIYGDVFISNNCTIDGNLLGTSFRTRDGLIDLSGGYIYCQNSITTNTLYTSHIFSGNNIIFDADNGKITAVELLLSGALQATSFQTDNVFIDSSGITTNAITVNSLAIEDNGETTFTLDQFGNINGNGYISVHGNIETINGNIIGNNAIIDGVVTCSSIVLPYIFLGNGTSITDEDFSGAILVKNDYNFTAIQPNLLVCGDISGNEVRINNNRIQITSDNEIAYFDFSGFQTKTINAHNVTVSDTLTIGNGIEGNLYLNGSLTTTNFTTIDGQVSMSSNTDIVKAKSIETDALIIDSSGVKFKNDAISITNVFEIKSNETTTTISDSQITLEDNSGNSTSLTANRLETKNLNADRIYASNITLGTTNAFYDLSGGYYNDIHISLSDISGMETKQFGPEYNVVIKIKTETDTILNIVLSVNFGLFFNELSLNVTGNLSDSHFNGPDRISRIIYNDAIFQPSEFTYTRTEYLITLSGNFIQFGKIFYDYYYIIGNGLGFDL